jgi:hypothetical protein
MMSSLQGENLFYPVPGSICKKKLDTLYIAIHEITYIYIYIYIHT